MNERGKKQRRRDDDQRGHEHEVEIVAQREPEHVALQQQPLEVKQAGPRALAETVPTGETPDHRREAGQDYECAEKQERGTNETEGEGGAKAAEVFGGLLRSDGARRSPSTFCTFFPGEPRDECGEDEQQCGGGETVAVFHAVGVGFAGAGGGGGGFEARAEFLGCDAAGHEAVTRVGQRLVDHRKVRRRGGRRGVERCGGLGNKLGGVAHERGKILGRDRSQSDRRIDGLREAAGAFA